MATAPLQKSKAQLRAAAAALAQMRAARHFTEFEAAWEEYLIRIERTWSKSARAFKSGKYEPWRGTWESERTRDALLRYLKQARDAQEHSLEEDQSLAAELGAIGISPASGTSMHIEELTVESGVVRIRAADPGVKVTAIAARVSLLPVRSRGTVTEPPLEHLGHTLDRKDPAAVAEYGLRYYERFLQEAQARFAEPRQGGPSGRQ